MSPGEDRAGHAVTALKCHQPGPPADEVPWGCCYQQNHLRQDFQAAVMMALERSQMQFGKMLFPVLSYSSPHPNWLDRKCCHTLLRAAPKNKKGNDHLCTSPCAAAGWITAGATLRQQPVTGPGSGGVTRGTGGAAELLSPHGRWKQTVPTQLRDTQERGWQ